MVPASRAVIRGASDPAMSHGPAGATGRSAVGFPGGFLSQRHSLLKMHPGPIHHSASPEEKKRHQEQVRRYDEETARMASLVIGMPEAEARTLVESAGREWQAVSPDSPVTMDFRPNRIRVVVIGGVVSRTT